MRSWNYSKGSWIIFVYKRWRTQAIVAATLGTSDDEQRFESLEGMQKSRFMLHYNFPPFSVERLEELVELEEGKSVMVSCLESYKCCLPKHENFPYTIRIVSDITGV